MQSRSEELKAAYRMERHVEGGAFCEWYTAPFLHDGRPLAGSIYYLLDAGELSRFHQIDCDEIWYYHEGCGMRITVLAENGLRRCLLGGDPGAGESASVVIPGGCVFAAENLRDDGFTFVSCLTVPKFAQEGYRLIDRAGLKQRFPQFYDELAYLAY